MDLLQIQKIYTDQRMIFGSDDISNFFHNISNIHLNNSQEPELHVFGPLEPKPLEKTFKSQSRLGKKSGAGSRFEEKKSGARAGAAKNKSGSEKSFSRQYGWSFLNFR